MSVPKRKSHNDVASSSARPRGRCPVSVCDATVAGSGETSVNIYMRAVPPRIRTCASATETVPFQRAWRRQGRHCRDIFFHRFSLHSGAPRWQLSSENRMTARHRQAIWSMPSVCVQALLSPLHRHLCRNDGGLVARCVRVARAHLQLSFTDPGTV